MTLINKIQRHIQKFIPRLRDVHIYIYMYAFVTRMIYDLTYPLQVFNVMLSAHV